MLKIRSDPECPVCSEHPTQTGLIDYEAFCGLGPSADNGASSDAHAAPAQAASAAAR